MEDEGRAIGQALLIGAAAGLVFYMIKRNWGEIKKSVEGSSELMVFANRPVSMRTDFFGTEGIVDDELFSGIPVVQVQDNAEHEKDDPVDESEPIVFPTDDMRDIEIFDVPASDYRVKSVRETNEYC